MRQRNCPHVIPEKVLRFAITGGQFSPSSETVPVIIKS